MSRAEVVAKLGRAFGWYAVHAMLPTGMGLITAGMGLGLNVSPAWSMLIPLGMVATLAYTELLKSAMRRFIGQVAAERVRDEIVHAEAAPVDRDQVTTGLWCRACAKPSGIAADVSLYRAGTTELITTQHVAYCDDCGRAVEETR